MNLYSLNNVILICFIIVGIVCQFPYAEASGNQKEGNWLQFGYDNSHTGYQSIEGCGNLSNYGTRWFKRYGDYNHDMIYGEPSVADINFDGQKEIIFGSENGSLYCLNPIGEEIWEFNTKGAIYSTPTLANLNSDSNLEIVIGDSSGIVSEISSNGNIIWEYQTLNSIVGSATIADITGDGNQDIVIGSNDGFLYTLTNNGELIWKYDTEGVIGTTAAVSDINNDNQNDIIVGDSNGIIYAITNRNIFDPIEKFNRSYFLPYVLWEFRTPTPNNNGLIGSAVIIDVNKDKKDEIIFGAEDGKLYCIDNDGNELWNYYTETPIYMTPAVADINNDEYLEIVFSSKQKLITLDSNGHLIWQKEFSMGINSNPTIFDINGDGLLEISTIDSDWISISPDVEFSFWINSTNILDYKGNIIKKFKFHEEFLEWTFGVSVVDLENDNKLEILTGTKNGFIYCYGELNATELEQISNNINNEPPMDNIERNKRNDFIPPIDFTIIISIIVFLIIILYIRKRYKD